VSIKQTGDSVTVYDIFNQDYPSKIGKIEFSGGSFMDFESIKQIALNNMVYYADDNNNRLDGSDKNDIMYGNKDTNYIHAGAGDDILIGGEGNDELYGEWGADTYIFGKGDGKDTIYADGEDIIKFKEGITRDDILITRYYNDLVIKLKDSDDSVRVSYMLYGSDDDSNDNPAGIKAIEFSDGSSLGLEYIRKMALANENSMFQGDNVYGFSSDDIINGSAERETINARSGNDVIDGKGGNDTIIGGKGDDGGKQGFPRQPRKENHKQARSHNQRGGAQIGLLQNQGDGHGNNRQRGKIMEPRKVVFIALEKPRHRHRQPDFHDFGRLQAHKAEIQPAR